jgi:mortality factor 4-like protein 1
MDSQSVNKLREDIQKLTLWLGKNSNRFFTAEYETTSNDYVENDRRV